MNSFNIQKSLDVSVIIPTNGQRPKMLLRAVNSISNQTVKPSEVIIIVDANITEYQKIIRLINNYNLSKELNIKVIHSGYSYSLGVSFARNLGAKIAKFTYLSFLDDDDTWKPEYLQKIFEDEYNFDIALAGFEKHKNNVIYPEKKPPKEIKIKNFLVANPGLRGSNITIRKDLYERIGGFSLDLPAFNDLDFGIKLSKIKNLKYRRIDDLLVEYHSHSKPRLSTPGCEANVKGIIQFLLKHGNKMSYIEESKFRQRCLKIWHIDIWDFKKLEERWEYAKQNNQINEFFPKILHALETKLYEEILKPKLGIRLIQKKIVNLCNQYESSNKRVKPPLINIAVILTYNPQKSLKELIESINIELNRFQWAKKFLNKDPINIYLYLNVSDIKIINKINHMVKNYNDNRIKIVILNEENEFNEIKSIGESRKYIIQKLIKNGFKPSKENILWFIDEDLRFINLIPYKKKFCLEKVGSIFHRIEFLVKSQNLDGIIGTYTGAPPVPILTTVYTQLKDLKAILLKSEKLLSWEETLEYFKKNIDYYYDLSRYEVNYKPVNFFKFSNNFLSIEKNLFLKDNILNKNVFNKLSWALLNGIPITRPLLNLNDSNLSTAWGIPKDVIVSGGNFLIVSSNLLESNWFYQLQTRDIKSRRSDTSWCVIGQQNGYKIKQLNICLLHNRYPLISYEDIEKFNNNILFKNLLEDALGVAFYEYLIKNGSLLENSSWKYKILKNFKFRIIKINCHLLKMKRIIIDISRILKKKYGIVKFKELPYWLLLKQISKSKIKIKIKKLNLQLN
ncbi:MAG: glycosyltransferase family 2 protein [Candidatus Helarchaeota archaeon]